MNSQSHLPERAAPGAEAYRFGPFRFGTRPFVLHRGDEELPLQGQPGLCLELFVRRAGEIVHRDEIREALWGDDRHVEWEQGINHVVRKIRKLLRDDARQPRYLETIPRVGYRFVADVREVEMEEATPAASMAAATYEGPPSPAGPRVAAWALAPVVLAGLLVTWLWATDDEGATRVAESSAVSALSDVPDLPDAARRAYLEGRHFMGRSEPSAARRAVDAFQQAVDVSPDFGAAHAGLSHALFTVESRTIQADPEVPRRARRAAERAIRLDDQAQGHMVLGLLEAKEKRNWGAAFGHLYRAIELDPELSEAPEKLTGLLAAQRRDQEARRLTEQSLARYPERYPELLVNLANLEYRAGRLPAALDLAEQISEVVPGQAYGWWLALRIHLDRGDEDLAFAAARGMTSRFGAAPPESLAAFWQNYDDQMHCIAQAGRPMDAQLGFSAWYQGRQADAVAALTRACRAGGSWAALLVAGDPVVEALRGAPGHDELLACLRRHHGPLVADLGRGAAPARRADVMALPALSFGGEHGDDPMPLASLGSVPTWNVRDAARRGL